MSERKVLNKYFPPDFDPSLIPRRRGSKNSQQIVCLMVPFSMRCNTCGEYIYKGQEVERSQGNGGLSGASLFLSSWSYFASQEQEAIYNLLLSVQSEMLREIKDGVSAREVYQRALDIVKKEKPELEKNFVKNAGFGVSDLLSNKCPPVSNSFRPEPSVSPRLRQAQLLQTQLSPHELVYQESFIREREAEI
ncbi:DUF572-domain-containing protein [Suillus brevipes Sb2]|nr:DUF572-domain-containing protein [Suillus brevipes Sb2]